MAYRLPWQLPHTFPSNLATKFDELPPRSGLLFERLTRSAAGVQALALHLTQYLSKQTNDLVAIWRVLEIISAVVADKASAPYRAALQSCLSGIISSRADVSMMEGADDETYAAPRDLGCDPN